MDREALGQPSLLATSRDGPPGCSSIALPPFDQLDDSGCNDARHKYEEDGLHRPALSMAGEQFGKATACSDRMPTQNELVEPVWPWQGCSLPRVAKRNARDWRGFTGGRCTTHTPPSCAPEFMTPARSPGSLPVPSGSLLLDRARIPGI